MDPTLEQDLQSKSKPWALSPLISTMPFVVHTRAEELHRVPPFPPIKPIQENTAELKLRDGKQPEYLQAGNNPPARREYFRAPENRKNVVFGPNVSRVSICHTSEIKPWLYRMYSRRTSATTTSLSVRLGLHYHCPPACLST